MPGFTTAFALNIHMTLSMTSLPVTGIFVCKVVAFAPQS